MEKRSSAASRLLAALALVAAVIVVVGVVATAMNSDSSSKGGEHSSEPAHKQKKQRTKAKTYTVESGDTLTAIAHKTGVPVAEILALNPEVDPQILIAGQTLQLK
ncbi:MAG: LysM peptidoglycan-binding domain-containing protein [Actinobacteria bacterium]|nr:MAG: LysM peptidoglycan-binding domain-containing protein [Actinomycetota bacterium]